MSKSAQITQFFLLTNDRYINAEYHIEITYLNIISNFAYNSIILINFTLNYYFKLIWNRIKKVHFLHHVSDLKIPVIWNYTTSMRCNLALVGHAYLNSKSICWKSLSGMGAAELRQAEGLANAVVGSRLNMQKPTLFSIFSPRSEIFSFLPVRQINKINII